MKKYFVWIGAAILVMAVATPSMAQFSSWGHMEIATYVVDKQDFNLGGYTSTGAAAAPDKDENKRWITQRFRFYLQYGDPKTVRAVIGFEGDSSNWGEPAWTNAASGGDSSTAANPSGRMGTYGTDQPVLEIKHAYMEFVVPTTPLVLTAGLQGFNFGGRLFQSKDAPGLTLTTNFAPHKIQAFWWRESDRAFQNYNVNDTYALLWQMTQKAFNVYAYGAYENDLDGVAHPTYKDHPYWIGVGGGLRPGNFDLSAQFIYNGGTRDFNTGDDTDYKGWVAEALAKYTIGPGMSVAVEGFYATGGDADKSNEFGQYTIPGTSEVRWSMGNNRSIFYFYNGDFMYTGQKQLDFAGLWYGRVNFEYNPVAWLNLNFNYLYIGDTRAGTPGAGKVVNLIANPASARQDKDEDFVGHEVNVLAKIQIYKGLSYNLGFGYFFPGDVYDASNKSADDAWTFQTCLRYFF